MSSARRSSKSASWPFRRLINPNSRRRRWISALSALAVGAGLVFGAGVVPASAAGPAVLSLEVSPVNATSGAPISTAGFGQNNNQVAYRVGYSCSVATCTDARVTLPATQLDPTYGQFRLLSYQTWTPPAGGGASITSSASGITVNLGDVPAGTSSTFLLVYSYPVEGGYTTAVDSAYFPPGFQIQQSATISSPNATGDVAATAAPVTWEIPIPEPSIAKVGSTSVRPDTDMTYTLRMGSGCFVNGGSGRIVGNGSQLCAESFRVVDELPDQAVFVSASDGGTYDSTTHTVVWTGTGPTAAGGWGSSASSGWVGRGTYHARTVTVRYPASAFPEADGGADFVVPVTNDVRVSMTYLDDAETVKTARASHTHDVARITPFGRATQTKTSTSDYTSGGRRYVDVPPNVAGMSCPVAGIDDWGRTCTAGQPLAAFATDNSNYWYLDTYNRGNVPAVVTLDDDDLADSSARVYRINTTSTTPAATIQYTMTNGTTTTTGTASGSFTAPTGNWITSATVTSGSIPAANLLPTDTGGTLFRVSYHYNLLPGAALGDWTNTVTGTMSYPGYPEITPLPVTSSGTVTLRELPPVQVAPEFRAEAVSATVAGGGQAVPGSQVTFAVRGSTRSIPADQSVSPQYVFLAPAGWEIVRGTAAFPADSVPPGAAYVYRDVIVAGVTRQAVVASWPTGTTFGSNVTWPNLTVTASPTFAVAAGTSSRADVWIGDSLNQYPADGPVWQGRAIDAPDVDRDGDTSEAFASDSISVTVSGSDRLDVIKEICVETADGCTWISNPDIVVGVAPDAEDITYRVTLRNGGNTTLTGVVGYDILPFVGDGRGSTFGETLSSVVSQTANVILDYSTSTNPCRDEVLPDEDNDGCSAAWGASASSAASIRAVVDGPLAPGQEATFTFAANVVPGAAVDAIACNSLAVDTASTVPAEPRAVCATTQEADLQITVPDRLPLQAGRPGVVPFTVTNLGGSEQAPATVTIDVPAGIRITDLTPEGWSCEASETDADGSVLGPVTLTCDAVTSTGSARQLLLDEPNALDLPAVIPSDALVGEDICFPGVVTGLMTDPDLSNNEDEACFRVAAGDQLVGLQKDDGLSEAAIGDELTYEIEVSNLLVGEALDTLTVIDELPSYLAFVRASEGGTVSDQGEEDGDGNLPGGTVTWTLSALAESGVVGDGGEITGGAGSTDVVTVTVRVLQSAETRDDVVNEATVTVTDPANPDIQLTASDTDTDDLLRQPAIQVVKSADRATVSAVGETVTYEFVVTNPGDVTLSDITVTETAFTGAGTPVDIVCPAAAPLAPGASVTCTAEYDVVQADLDTGFILNTATATGTPPAGLSAVTSLPSMAVVGADVDSALTLTKTASPSTATSAGDEISYEFVVTNAGTVSVTDIAIVETDFSGSADGLSDIVCDQTGSVAPGGTVTCSATYVLTQTDVDAGAVTNTATATADAPGSVPDPTSDPATAVVTIPAEGALSLDKTVGGLAADEAGDTVTYLFAVTNTGNVTLDDIAVSESSFTGAGDDVVVDCPAGALAPGAETTCVGTYVLVQEDVDTGRVDNTAVATAVAPDGDVVTSDDSSAELLIPARAALTLLKSGTPTDLVAGEEITYTFVITNAGNVTVTDAEIREEDFTGSGSLSTITCDDASSLAPGEQAICSATYVITQDDVDSGRLDNTAVAQGEAPAGTVSSAPSTVQLPIDPEPSLEVVKTADVTGYRAVGDAIGYSFRVTNTGNVTIEDVSIVEESFSGTGELTEVVCAPGALAPGAYLDCTADYAVTQADLDAGEVVNTAHAGAASVVAGEPIVSDASTVTVPFVGVSALALTKSGAGVDADDDGRITAGDAIRWTFLVTNTGATTVTDLDIDDPMIAGVTCEATVLTPGASVACVGDDYEITAADAEAGTVRNTATATGLGVGGVTVSSAEATAAVEVEEQPVVPGLPDLPGLPVTGGELAVWLIVLAVLLVLAGAVVIHLGRRRVAADE